jgi:LysR family transcriptional activator of nhaA
MSALNYNHLRYFWAVAHDGNLTRTAARLNLTQSALSVQIRKLEERLGHALFERRGRQLHLTEVGRITLDHADAIFATGDELLGTLRNTRTSRQALRVGVQATLSRNFQLEFLQPVLGRDDIQIVVRSGNPSELLASLQSLSLDLVLITRAPSHDALTPLVFHRLAERAVSLIGTPKRLRKRSALVERLQRHPLILPSKDTSIRTGFDAMVDRLGIRPHVAAEVDDMAMLRLLARADIGLAVLPAIVEKDEITAGVLIEGDPLPGISEVFYAVTLDRRFPNPLVRELIQHERELSGMESESRTRE